MIRVTVAALKDFDPRYTSIEAVFGSTFKAEALNRERIGYVTKSLIPVERRAHRTINELRERIFSVIMLNYSDDSSDRDEKLFYPKTRVLSLSRQPVNNQKSTEVSTTHGIVVNDRTGSGKSPTKQSRKTNDSERSKDTSKERAAESDHSDEKEPVARPHVRNIKVEKFSGSESEDVVPDSRNASQANTSWFDEDEDEDEKSEVLNAKDRAVAAYDPDDIEKTFYQDNGASSKSVKKQRVVVKKEQISSEDEETVIRKDPDDDIVSPQKKLPKFKGSEKDAGGSNSDNEIPASQYWLHHYKEMEKMKDKKASLKVSPIKNSDTEESGNLKNIALGRVDLSPKKESRKKSPPRITKTKIISTKYKRINQQIPETKEESSNYTASSDGLITVPKKKELANSQRSDDERDEKVFQENEKSGDSRSSDDELNTSKKTPPKKLTPNSKKQSPKKTQASPKRKLSSKAEATDDKSSIKRPAKVPALKQKLNDSVNKKSLQIRENVCDDTTSEEEAEHVEREGTQRKYVLAIQKPDKSSQKTSGSSGRQTILVAKANDKILENNKPKVVPKKLKSPPPKATISHANNVNDDSSSEESASKEALRYTIKRKVSPKKRQQVSSSSEEEAEPSVKKEAIRHSSSTESPSAYLKRKSDPTISPVKKKPVSSSSDEKEEREAPTVRKGAAIQAQETIKHRPSTGSASASLKRRLVENEALNTEETPEPRNAAKAPSKKKKLESQNPPEEKSNKRAKLMPPSKLPSHSLSDSDDTDSLTKLNTTLNKSMALMENKSVTVESQKKGSTEARKSVSINTKHTTKHIPNDSLTQKSILKRPELPSVDDNTESDSLSQEQTVQKKVEPIVLPPKIITRPLNLRDFEKQESLTYDSNKASFGLENISDDDEIYILDVPRTVDPKELRGQVIRLGGKNKLQIGDQLYETCGKDAANISCVFRTSEDESSYRAVNIKPAGCINVRQKLSKRSQIELTPLEKRSVPFPKNLKVRHPLLGAAFEDKIVNVDMKVLKKSLGSMKRAHSITKLDEPTKTKKRAIKLNNVEKKEKKRAEHSEELIKSEVKSKPTKTKKRAIKLNNVEKKEKKRAEHSEELIKSEVKSKPKAKVGKRQQVPTNNPASSDSDSDQSFFQQVKRENIEEPEDKKDFKNLSSILNLDETPLDTDLPMELEKTVIVKKSKLSPKNKLGLSMNDFAIKRKSLDVASEHSKFVSSTPIKVEKGEKSYEGEIPINKVRKRKNHSVS